MLGKTLLKVMQQLGSRTVIESSSWHLVRQGRPVQEDLDASVLLDPAVLCGQASVGVVLHVRFGVRQKLVCGVCGQPGPQYDPGSPRLWRGVDLGVMPVWIRARIPRVSCPVHGARTARVDWARHDAGQTRAFEDTVAWMVAVMNKSAVAHYLRLAWRTVGSILSRVEAEFSDPARGGVDRLAGGPGGLRRIGIDEISYKKGHKYLTVVVDHDTGRLVFAAEGRTSETLTGFFTQLGERRSAALTHVSADGAAWISDVVRVMAPGVVLCMDPFHVVAWASTTLDALRRKEWREYKRIAKVAQEAAAKKAAADAARGVKPKNLPGPGKKPGSLRDQVPEAPSSADSQRMTRARWALLKNPDTLTATQRATLDWIAAEHPDLHHAWSAKEALRMVFATKGEAGVAALDVWIARYRQDGVDELRKLAYRVDEYRDRIANSLLHRLSNGLIESTNTKTRVLHRAAFGFKRPENMIALMMLSLGGSRPVLPGRGGRPGETGSGLAKPPPTHR